MRLESRLVSLRIECLAEGRRGAAVAGSYSELAARYGGSLLCDEVTLIQNRAGYDPLGVQGRLVQTHLEFSEWRYWTNVLSVSLAIIFAIPWFWYFALERIAEIRQAISGK